LNFAYFDTVIGIFLFFFLPFLVTASISHEVIFAETARGSVVLKHSPYPVHELFAMEIASLLGIPHPHTYVLMKEDPSFPGLVKEVRNLRDCSINGLVNQSNDCANQQIDMT
jgi:hypothetical protein